MYSIIRKLVLKTPKTKFLWSGSLKRLLIMVCYYLSIMILVGTQNWGGVQVGGGGGVNLFSGFAAPSP